MDRTGIAPWKAEEKELSEKLHEKLQGLALLYPMTEEMVKLLSWDMFLKPNQAAFFQVMHYLFCILDPVEFKKRFYWPITDKKAEAVFRSGTVDYLKHLNEKHQLNWANIKSYLVVMPGGMRFINFLLVLVGFVLQEVTKQREKVLAAHGIDITNRDLSIQQMLAQNSFMKEYASGYIEELKQTTCRLRRTTQKIKDIFSEIAKKTNVAETLLLNDKFLEDFEAYNRLKCEKNITKPAEKITTLEDPQCVLKDAMDQFLARQTELKQHQDAADYTLRNIRLFFGNLSNTSPGNATGNALMSTFNGISEAIAEQLDANDHYNESNSFVTQDLQELTEKLQQIEIQVNDVQKNLNQRAKGQNCNNLSGNVSELLQVPSTPMRPFKSSETVASEHPLLMKFVSTPPIKPEAGGAVRKVNVRLPLQDDFNAKQFENKCNSLMAPAPPRSMRKPDHYTELNSTLNRSKIFDPMQVLRTVNKKSKPNQVGQHNLSNLGSKWKQLHASFGFDEPPQIVPTSPQPNTFKTVPQSPFTPLNLNELTKIERFPQLQIADTSNNSLYAKSAAVMKVLDASLNVKNLSTSPSGRLEALVPGPLIELNPLPAIQLNDKTLNDSSTPLAECVDANQLNPQPSKFNLSHLENDDFLQNVSDTVLKDIDF